ncbi:MAG: sulfite oxidase [Pseudonocardiales bacterium]|nr:MAG: sulfite oxidase [Pseudonocardiales bacterium]
MDSQLDAVSRPSRVAEAGEAISAEELQLATRNHGLPLEALRFDITPPGLHYLLTHYDIPVVDPATYRLTVDGLVDTALTLDLDNLRSRPKVSMVVTFECAGNGRARLLPRPVSQPWLVEAVGNSRWTGTPLAPLLREASLHDRALDIVFTGIDHGVERGIEQVYQRSLSVSEALRGDVLLVYEMNGAPLPPQHGYPLRLVVPGWYGMAQVKWLDRISAVAEPFDGYQMRAYRLRQHPDDPGVPLTRIEPRALLAPPGFPDFMSRARVLRAGPTLVEGRAWSGFAPVSAVDVSVDGGLSWSAATVEPAPDRWGWVRWIWPWAATEGSYVLTACASDASGRSQPIEQSWNRGGFANNLVQRVPLTVISPAPNGGRAGLSGRDRTAAPPSHPDGSA